MKRHEGTVLTKEYPGSNVQERSKKRNWYWRDKEKTVLRKSNLKALKTQTGVMCPITEEVVDLSLIYKHQ